MSLLVTGGQKLFGEIDISGAKNGALPVIVASMLTAEKVVLSNIPKLSDICVMNSILESLGCKVHFENNILTLEASNITSLVASYDMVSQIRASIWLLAPLIARFGKAKIALPGGCNIGARQIDMHLDFLKAIGTEINIEEGYIIAQARKLHGAEFEFHKISVGATINAILGSVLIDKELVVLRNCAIEPEIQDLCNFLLKMGANIEGNGTREIKIRGVSVLSGTEHKVIADRVEAGTYMIAAGITRGKVKLNGITKNLVDNFCSILKDTGIGIEYGSNSVVVDATNIGFVNSVNMETNPYPGFPTDLQAQYVTLMSVSNGESTITENLFENRFMYVSELTKLGAQINFLAQKSQIRVNGVKNLVGTEVRASDLRASVSLVLAGLVATGETCIQNDHYIARGYENFHLKLRNCGAIIKSS